MQKGIAQVYLLIVLLIVGGLGGYYYFSKSSNKPIVPQPTSSITPTKAVDETANPDSIGANWKTYTNQNKHISFSYPPNWKVEEELGNPLPGTVIVYDPQSKVTSYSKYYPEGTVGYSLNVRVGSTKGTLLPINKYIEYKKNLGYTGIEQININGNQSIRYYMGSSKDLTYIDISNGEVLVYISYASNISMASRIAESIVIIQ